MSPRLALTEVLELLKQNDFEAGFDPELSRTEHAANFNALDHPAKGFLVYARVGRRLVGYARLMRILAPGLGVVAITVLEGYRRKRIGEAMLRALLDAAAGPCAMHEVWLSVRQNNIPAIRLYEKLGFVRRTDRPAGDWAAAAEIAMAWLSPVILYPQKS